MSSIDRIIVGASGSPGNLRALRYAQRLARDLDATLVPVLSWPPPDGDLADRRNARYAQAFSRRSAIFQERSLSS